MPTKVRILHWPVAWLSLSCVLFSGACAQKGGQEPRKSTSARPAAAAGVEPLLRERTEKDLAYKQGSNSPIPDEDKPRFQGLAYFPLDPAFRLTVKLNRYPRPERVRLTTNTPEKREALRYGYFEFQVEGKTCRLQVYRTEDSESGGKPYLFIPFRDATTGKETYGGGRYLDLQENTAGIYDLDFNRAYNPLCAYGRDYSCPVPPEENRLSVAILAGEKAYPLSREHN
jgi:uncharacterized protein (DUF1684 family)